MTAVRYALLVQCLMIVVAAPPSLPACQWDGDIDMGGSVTLSCSVAEGVPTPEIHWDKLNPEEIALPINMEGQCRHAHTHTHKSDRSLDQITILREIILFIFKVSRSHRQRKTFQGIVYKMLYEWTWTVRTVQGVGVYNSMIILLKGPVCRIYGQNFNVILLIIFSLVFNHKKLRIVTLEWAFYIYGGSIVRHSCFPFF